jgi:hypothetical protein
LRFMKESEKKETSHGKIRIILFNFIRIILVLAFILAYMAGRNLIAIVAVFAFILTFWPRILRRLFRVKVPAEFEVFIILFIYGIFLFGKIQGFHLAIPLWSTLFNVAGAVALGLVGFAFMYALYKGNIVKGSPFVIAFFSFCFAVAVGAVWELFEFFLDNFLGFNLQGVSSITADLMTNISAALIISALGYFYIKNGKMVVISNLMDRFVESNPKLFGSELIDRGSEEIATLVKKGEGSKLEFKSSLRTNMFTKSVDKRVEHSVLKTITSYLNSNGGTLLIGVSDKGEILGVDGEGFSSVDRLNLHFTNLIKDHVGNEYLPFIKSGLVRVGDKNVLKVDCVKSQRHVFLKHGEEEEFYVRNGPSSTKLLGSELVDYIRHNFKSP